MGIKLPLQRSFAFLCGFVATLCDGLETVAEGATENELMVDDLRAALVAGTEIVGQSGEA